MRKRKLTKKKGKLQMKRDKIRRTQGGIKI